MREGESKAKGRSGLAGAALEVVALALMGVAFASFAMRFDVSARIDAYLRRHELYHLDEIVLTLLFTALVFSFLSLRRWAALVRRNRELDRAERALANERDFTSTVLDTVSSLVLVLDRDGRVLRFNPCCERVSGFAASEVLGRPYWELLIPPVSVEERRDAFARLLTTRGTSSDVSPWLARDGTERMIEWTNTVVDDDGGHGVYVVSTGRDVTEERRSREELRFTEQKLQSIVGSIDDFVWSQRADTREMIFVSPSFERVFGIPAEALRDDPRAWIATLHPDDRERAHEFVRQLTGSGRAALEYRVVHPDGGVRWVHDRAWAVRDEAGRVVRFDGIARDITDQKLLEEQFRQSQKMEAVGLLAGGIAHDFNNLLTAIGGYADLLRERLDGDATGLRSAEAIRLAADRAASLTRQLLAFSRRQVLQPKVFNPNALLVEMEPLVRRLIGEDVDLRVATAPDLGDVRADPGQIEQVVMNLAVNARDAMPGGGRLAIETRNVDLSPPPGDALAPGPYVAILVSDSGEGMDPAVLARIFEPFFTTKPLGKGTGLGLSTAYGIVRQSGGSIDVHSIRGDGTTFRVLLPRYAGARPAPAPLPPPLAVAHRGETLLVVEDEPSVLDLAREILEGEGYAVLVASNGREAVDLARRHAGKIELIATDVVMPQMGGIEMVETLAPSFPDVPVLFMSGYSEAVVRREGNLAPGAGFLQKPFAPSALLRAVRDALDRVASSRE